MPRSPEPHCPEPGCSNRGRCTKHGYRSRSAKKYNQRAWRDLSRRIRRDRPTCETPGCDNPSEQVDHIDGDEDNDAEWNLQALCRPCHSTKGHLAGELSAPTRERRGRHGATAVTVVAGPPAAGKSTYVHENAQPGDLVVDYDAIYAALSGQPTHVRPDDLRGLVLDARDAVLSRLEIANGEVARAWIIHAAPLAEQRASLRARFDAEIVLLLPDRRTCEQRLRDRERAGAGDGWLAVLDQWFRTYEPSPSDRVIRDPAAVS